jgi:biotin carboxyl carrier protein
MPYIVSHQGRDIRVQVQERPDGLYRVLLEDQEYLVDYLEPQPNVLSLLIDGHSHEVDVDQIARDRFDVVLEGDSYVIDVAEAKTRKRSLQRTQAATGPQEIKSRMAGLVRAVLAQPGDRVVAGQPLLILEAMKMQNEIASPIDGTIVSVRVREGVSVGGQDLLCIVEPVLGI